MSCHKDARGSGPIECRGEEAIGASFVLNKSVSADIGKARTSRQELAMAVQRRQGLGCRPSFENSI
jgi:hypothetical protein